MDEFAGRMNKVELTFLLQLLDRYPVSAPVKGAFIWWRPRVIFITTNYRPCDWYDWKDRMSSFVALKRRVTRVSIWKDDRLYEYDHDVYQVPRAELDSDPDIHAYDPLSWFWTEPLFTP
jgi:hypothetical protein